MINYRNIIKSRNLRVRLLSFFDWVPDSIMLRLQYWIQTGRKLNLNNPQRYTEKLQLYKLKYRNPEMLRCTDKYEVRKYVEEKGYGDYLIPLLGVYNSVDDVEYPKLPNQFVAKTTDGGGGNQVFICKDKNSIKEEDLKQLLNRWMVAGKPKRHVGREWAYQNNYARRIIIEEFIQEKDVNKELCDYKFFCFQGKVSYIYGLSDRIVGKSVKLGIYDSHFNKIEVTRNDEIPQEIPIKKPINFDKMISIAEGLSNKFPHVRVDLYNIEGQIYFGELTFYDGSGYMTFSPDSFDEEMGRKFDVSAFC